eukprot:1393055-Amphidinium_carterae.1
MGLPDSQQQRFRWAGWRSQGWVKFDKARNKSVEKVHYNSSKKGHFAKIVDRRARLFAGAYGQMDVYVGCAIMCTLVMIVAHGLVQAWPAGAIRACTGPDQLLPDCPDTGELECSFINEISPDRDIAKAP